MTSPEAFPVRVLSACRRAALRRRWRWPSARRGCPRRRGRCWSSRWVGQGGATGERLPLGNGSRVKGLLKAQRMPLSHHAAPTCLAFALQFYPEHKSPLQRVLKMARGEEEGEGGRAPDAAPAAWASAAAAAALGQQLTSAELALLHQQLQALQGGGVAGPQCLALDAERLAASL